MGVGIKWVSFKGGSGDNQKTLKMANKWNILPQTQILLFSVLLLQFLSEILISKEADSQKGRSSRWGGI